MLDGLRNELACPTHLFFKLTNLSLDVVTQEQSLLVNLTLILIGERIDATLFINNLADLLGQKPSCAPLIHSFVPML